MVTNSLQCLKGIPNVLCALQWKKKKTIAKQQLYKLWIQCTLLFLKFGLEIKWKFAIYKQTSDHLN